MMKGSVLTRWLSLLGTGTRHLAADGADERGDIARWALARASAAHLAPDLALDDLGVVCVLATTSSRHLLAHRAVALGTGGVLLFVLARSGATHLTADLTADLALCHVSVC